MPRLVPDSEQTGYHSRHASPQRILCGDSADGIGERDAVKAGDEVSCALRGIGDSQCNQPPLKQSADVIGCGKSLTSVDI
ncbi:Uncharacterised protein [Mycobacteroides abscessus]|nr:Uncharacterised protein [Mycobacteroides abscessus]